MSFYEALNHATTQELFARFWIYLPMMVFTGNQLRAARSLAGMDQRTLAARIGINLRTIVRMEAYGAEIVQARTSTIKRITDTLAELGVEMTNGEKRGVRLL